MKLQPCDWVETDDKYKYVVDVFGRTEVGEVARLRITGFSPYFYVKYSKPIYTLLPAIEKSCGKMMFGTKVVPDSKLDAMNGFTELEHVPVYKIICPSLWAFKSCVIGVKSLGWTMYESDLPPFLRLFHQTEILPASAIEFESDDFEAQEDENTDVFYTCHYSAVKPVSTILPLLVCAYDIETYSESGNFPSASNASDEIIQIGLSFRMSTDMLANIKRVVLVSGTCEPSKDPSVKFVSFPDERSLLIGFQNFIKQENPDVICGYNTYGFDDGYIADRMERCRVKVELSRVNYTPWKKDPTAKKTFELASGKFAVRYLELSGRLSIDLIISARREHNLDSYKLDSVANTFLRDKVTDIIIITGGETRQYEIHTKSTRGLFVGNLVRFDIVGNTVNPYADGMKFKVKSVFPKKFIVELEEHNYLCTFCDISVEDRKNLEWSFGKDDITAAQMFESHRGSAEQRSIIAKYCIQDCDLVLTLMAKLDTLTNSFGMADVCRVPVQYVFLRGQGIRIYSAVVYNASKRDQIILTQESSHEDSSYEGAIVLPPKIGMYLDQPIPVLDFNSLYPSNMIAFNLSPDTLVYVKTYDSNGKKISHQGLESVSSEFVVDEISYDVPEGRRICGFVQPTSDPRTVGVLPLTLDILLKKRKETRKLLETTTDDSQRSVLNGLQLAYKLVANSVYGQTGSRTSAIRKSEVAACTTAAGRDRIQFAKKIIETEFNGEIVYGDTDSVFIKFPTKDLAESMELAKRSADRITSLCRKPYKIEYEKTFFPFLLFCRKRYVGLMYEDDVKKCKRKTMGVALKRRDNAPIVKDVFGGALDILLEKRDIRQAQVFVQQMLEKVMRNEIPLDKFVVTKQLRDDYKNPEQIAHRVLADRMGERDPGNAPAVGERLAYIYVDKLKDANKQGDRIEHLDYVREHKLKPDIEFYITNQIQNPVAQLFALAIEDLEGYTPRKYAVKEDLDEEDATLYLLKQKEQDLDSILFMGAPYLKKLKRGPMDMFLKRK